MSLKISCLIILSDRQMVRFTPELGGWGGWWQKIHYFKSPCQNVSWAAPGGALLTCPFRTERVPSGCAPACFPAQVTLLPGSPGQARGGGGELLGPAHARLLCRAVFAQKLLVRLARMATQGSPCPASCPVISQGCYLPSTNTPPALLPPPQLPLPTALHWQTPYLCIFPVSQSGSIINVNG